VFITLGGLVPMATAQLDVGGWTALIWNILYFINAAAIPIAVVFTEYFVKLTPACTRPSKSLSLSSPNSGREQQLHMNAAHDSHDPTIAASLSIHLDDHSNKLSPLSSSSGNERQYINDNSCVKGYD
jgi:hypothetical protein